MVGAELPAMPPKAAPVVVVLVGARDCLEASWFMVGAEVVTAALLLGESIRLSMSMLRPD